jgi:transmembrane sensor
MNTKEIEALLIRYRKGNCTTEEKLRVEQWFDSQGADTDWQWSSGEQADIQKDIKSRIDSEIDYPTSKTYTWIKPV